MREVDLFKDSKGYSISNIDLLNVLKDLEADKCDVLYVHSALNFGVPNPVLKRKELLSCLLEVFQALRVKTLCMPTFTFSFCNGRDYDPLNSPSKMGALNEFFRKQDGVLRSLDPLMSVALCGEDIDLVKGIGHSSIGDNSTFDKLRHRDNVKFLFFGPKIGDCLTYMHYLEWLYCVDYRYDRVFRGNVVNDGLVSECEYNLFVRYNGVQPNTASYEYENMMYAQNRAFIKKMGDSSISIVDEKNASCSYRGCLEKDPYFFVDIKNTSFYKDRTFILDKEMIAL